MPITTGPSRTIAQVIVKALLAAAGGTTKPVSLTFYYQRTAGLPASSAIALSNAFLAGPYAAMLAAFNIGWTLGTTNIRFMDDVTFPVLTTSLAGVGAIATDRAPSFNAVYMGLKANIRGKKYQSSKHFPAVNEIDTTGDVLTGAGLTRWQAVATAILASLTDAGGVVWNPVTVTRKGSTIKTSPEIIIWNPITSIVLDITLGTMRRRKVKTVV